MKNYAYLLIFLCQIALGSSTEEWYSCEEFFSCEESDALNPDSEQSSLDGEVAHPRKAHVLVLGAGDEKSGKRWRKFLGDTYTW